MLGITNMNVRNENRVFKMKINTHLITLETVKLFIMVKLHFFDLGAEGFEIGDEVWMSS